MTTYISCADTAKLIRQSLKEAFAGVKFSVKSKTYSGGASITIYWTDGPNEAQIKAVVGRFSCSYFDGMQDLQGSKFHMMDGKAVSFGADYVCYSRDYSDAAIEKAIARVFRQFAGNFSGSGARVPVAADFRSGDLRCVLIPQMGAHHSHDLQYFVRTVLTKNSDRLHVKPSPTAGKVFQTHTDRNGQSSFDAVRETL